jgi:ABC-type phosphate transport system substrate-binding protein
MKDFMRSFPFRLLAPFTLLVCWLFSANTPAFGFADDYVVIVNKANPVDSISAADLKKMFLGEKTTWPNSTKVIPITPGQDRPEFVPAIKRATGMSSADFKRYFIQLSFLGKVVAQPKTLDSTAAIARYISSSPGAISCVPAADAGSAVKILKVE